MPQPTAKSRTIRIFAKKEDGNPNEYSFSMDDGAGGAANLEFDKDQDGMNKEDYYLIEFQLDNSQAPDLVFAKDREEVLWASTDFHPQTGCPKKNHSYMDTVFYVHPSMPIEDNKLYVINTDMVAEQFGFAFRFLNNGQGKKYIAYDPIGTNKNGGVGNMTLLSATTVFAFAAGALATTAVMYFAGYLG